MAKYDYSDACYSDLHKDARGFRPSIGNQLIWNDSTPEQKQRIWNGLCDELAQRMADEKAEQERASHDFEVRVQDLMLSGAKDRGMAIKWLHEAYDTRGDTNYLEYHLGLPYGYIK